MKLKIRRPLHDRTITIFFQKLHAQQHQSRRAWNSVSLFVKKTAQHDKQKGKIVDFKKARVNAHNNWPSQSVFKAEVMFEEKLKEKIGEKIFIPMKISYNENPDYQRCVGHLLDALESLPRRPDYFFDHCFRIIDISGSPLAPNKGISGVVKKLGIKLLNQDKSEWEQITDILYKAAPLRSYEWLAKRIILAASPSAPNVNKQLNSRAEKCFGTPFHEAFIKKYMLDSSGNIIPDAAEKNKEKAAKLLKLYFSGNQGTREKPASDPALDLTKKSNVPKYERRIEALPSLFLFTLRNERAHGNVISPFRTSRANIDRYQSYYFNMMVAYSFAIGAMILQYDCAKSSDVLDWVKENANLQKNFFA